MPTITEMPGPDPHPPRYAAQGPSRSFGQETRRLTLGALAAAAIWFGGMAGAALLVDAPALIVFAPATPLEQAIDRTGAAVVAFGQGYVVARGGEPGLARRLYGQGAWFVWPALYRACAAEKPRAG